MTESDIDREAGEKPPSAGMIVREKEPVNLETPFGNLDALLTPMENFYVRCHHALPEIDLASWRLRIEGEVDHPCELSYDEMREMESRTIVATMECAGNGRVFLKPQRDGAQWETGAVGTAEWTGVPLASVLSRVGLREGVCEVILEGADEGKPDRSPCPDGEIRYSRSLPLAKANLDVLLALRMNGEDLGPRNGFPLRAVVPGWYGMAAVKWLTRIVASSVPYNGYYQTVDYSYWERRGGQPSLVPISEMMVKSQIARPGFSETVRAGGSYRVHGAAWTSGAEIEMVEVSTDGGASWNRATLQGESAPDVWRLWEYEWKVPEAPGKTVLMARATDTQGRCQPSGHHDDYGSYLIHHCLPVEVWIR
jgi:DMSO/TMAO reductase YedYZ molybdopterin-dependent catalytic subunit